jgi:hypothetical protein
MSVATNHIKNCNLSNCGDRALIPGQLAPGRHLAGRCGGGYQEAMQPVVVECGFVLALFLGQID